MFVSAPASAAFIASLGDSSSARAIAARDWSATALGPIDTWPAHLLTILATVVRSSVPMTLMWGERGLMLYNEGYAEVVGAAHPGAMGKPALELWPEAADFNANVLREVGAGANLRYRDIAFELTRGGVRERAWFNLDYSPVFDSEGKVAGVLAVVIENTALMRALADSEAAAEARRAAETRNRQILDSAIDSAIIAIDLKGLVTRWNEGARRLLGWTEEDMLGQPLDCIYTREDQAAHRVEQRMRDALATGVESDERWHLRRSGERFWAAGEVTPLLDDEGAAIGFVKVLRDRTEQHHAALALRTSQQQLDRAQDAGGVGTFTLDLKTNLVHANRGFWRLFGLPDIATMPAAEVEALVLPEDMAIRSGHKSREDRSARLDVEYRIRRASDGAIRWIARRAEFERDDDGDLAVDPPSRMVGVVQDITERRVAEEAVRASAAQFRTLAQALPDQVWTVTPDGRIDWCNDRVHQFRGDGIGITGAGADGPFCSPVDGDDPFPVLIDAAARATVAQRWRDSVASGAEFHTELRLQRFDGAWRWHLVRVQPLRLEGGAISRWIGTATDIEERKQSEVRSARALDRIWTLSQELMLVCETGGRIVAINPAFTRRLGWAEHEIVGTSLADIIHPEDIPGTSAELQKLAGGAPTLAFENRYRGKDEQYRLLNWTAVPDEGLVHAVARDVTRERIAEESLRQAQKLEAIGQLTGGVAHDFNNVLAVMRTSIDLLRMVSLDDTRRRRYMEAIADAVTRAPRLTGQLLAFARRQALQPVVFDVRHNVDMVSEMIASLTGARIAREIRLGDIDCHVDADPSQFDTALVNLAVNARDAMDSTGKLTITVQRASSIPPARGNPAVAGEFVAVSVADTGVGIAEQFLSQIFEPFFTTKGAGQGTGLGLSQVFGFAKQSGGEIVVESAVGHGTTFTLYLPRVAQPGHTLGAAAGMSDNGIARGAGELVLVVEDNADVAESVQQTLGELGYVTELAGSGEAALRLLEHDAGRFATVFSDVVMGGMNGIELGEQIRARYPGLPVVLSSGYSYVLAKNPGHGFKLLPKPYALEDLAATLQEAIAGGQQRRAPLQAGGAAALAQVRAGGDALLFRQAELDAMRIIDSGLESSFDELTALAARIFGTPIAIIALADGTRQYFKSRSGTDIGEAPLAGSLCQQAIDGAPGLLVLPDARVSHGGAVEAGAPLSARFYAAAPLVSAAGHALGVLCVIDHAPRQVPDGQMEMLQFLAAQAVERMEARKTARGA